ncbi:ATPase [Candidatus Magnetomoraceae bacterium gMMP-15]
MLHVNTVAHIYNPQNQSREELINNFVIRKGIFKKIFKDIKNAPMKRPEQHYIIQGIRGSGKTTLLLRLYYAVLNDKNLHNRLVPIIFNEEQYGIRSLFRLWNTVADYLEEENPEDFQGIYEKIEAFEDDNDADRCYEIITRTLKNRKKKLILFIDNIGDLFNKFKKQEQQRFREILLTSSDIRIIGASAKILEHTYDYSKPFFDFFKFIHLKKITQKEANSLLLHLSNSDNKPVIKEIVKNQQHRVEALRRITGGIPRTIILMCEVFVDNVNGDSFKDLELILDRVTPLYKHRMDDLSPQQQDIVDTIAMNWDAITTKEIAKKIRMESKSVSSQLRQLEKNHIIHKIQTSTKNHLYQITERFFNIWYLMRCGRKRDKNRVLWLVRFLETWCSQAELIERAEHLKQALTTEDYYPKHAFFIAEGLIEAGLPEDHQHKLIQEMRKFLKNKDKKLLKELSKSDIELFDESWYFLSKKDFNNSIQRLKKIKNKDGFILYSLAVLYQTEFKLYDKAEKYYLMAVEKGYTSAMFNLAALYFRKFNEVEKSVQFFLKFLNHIKNLEEYHKYIQDYLILLIAKNQHHFALKLFQDKSFQLMDRYKPVYYALMSLMQDEYPNEIKKMGEELKETVDEILEIIDIWGRDYA